MATANLPKPTQGSKPAETPPQSHRALVAATAALAAVTLWSYWPTLAELVGAWSNNPQYSHGFLVPIIAAAVLWTRRAGLARVKLRPSLWGIPALIAVAAMRLGGAFFYYGWFDQMSLVLCVAALCLLVAGWAMLRWFLPAIIMLFFAVPLPFRLESALAWPLQRLATESTAYLLQTCGRPAIPMGNIVSLEGETLDVAQACSGLRMLLGFVCLSVAVAFIAQRPLWERIAVVLSSVPIALISNIVRISITGLLMNLIGTQKAQVFFHDVSGYLMMPFALVLLLVELALLSRLIRVVDLGGGLRPAMR